MYKFLRWIGWKDYRGRWDKFEIQVDISAMIGLIMFVWFIVELCYL